MSPRRALLAVLAALFLASCADSEADSEGGGPEAVGAAGGKSPSSEAARVETQRVELGRLQSKVMASGSVRARRVTEVAAEVTGRIVEVLVDVGDAVAERAPLFRIDPVPYETALAEARAGLALARAESENAALEAGRIGRLVEQRAASEQRQDQRRTEAAVARARVAQMLARVERAERDLERTVVYAPYDASVVERLAHEGSLAGEDPILILQETGALEAVINIPEATPVPVRVGDSIHLVVEGLSVPLGSRVERVSDRVDPETRTYEVRGPVRDPSRTVKAGSYLRAEIVSMRAEPKPVVDRTALVMRDGRSYVFRVADRTAELVPVRVGTLTDQHAEILSGVEAGDEIVRGEIVGRLNDGERIRTRPDASTAAHEAGTAS